MDKIMLWCECCGGTFPRWDIEIVEPSKNAKLLTDDFNMACPTCIQDKQLSKLDNAHAIQFRESNEHIKKVYLEYKPSVVH